MHAVAPLIHGARGSILVGCLSTRDNEAKASQANLSLVSAATVVS